MTWPLRPAGHLAGLRCHPRHQRRSAQAQRGRIPPPVCGGVAGRRRPEGRGQPLCLVPADQQQRRPWHQVAARPAPVVAQERPHPAGAGGRRDRPDPPGRQARAVVQRQAAGAEAAGTGQLHPGGRSGA
ncbi:hypothetical protein G6F24_016435 [Rhizopus arrhizus]|nr:hypothetical protein G6F24_016435 [Rhizopus arrhizus]